MLCKYIEESFNPGPRLAWDSELQISINNADLDKNEETRGVIYSLQGLGVTKRVIAEADKHFRFLYMTKNKGNTSVNMKLFTHFIKM